MRMTILFLLLMLPQFAICESVNDLVETRYCGEPKRDADGKIIRSKKVIAAFKREHPCPSTGLVSGRCDGWAIDHVIPLASCGCDAVWNMQWLPNQIKNYPGQYPKDRWEREVYKCPEAK